MHIIFEAMLGGELSKGEEITITCPLKDFKMELVGEENTAIVDGKRYPMTEAQYNKIIRGLRQKDQLVKGL